MVEEDQVFVAREKFWRSWSRSMWGEVEEVVEMVEEGKVESGPRWSVIDRKGVRVCRARVWR